MSEPTYPYTIDTPLGKLTVMGAIERVATSLPVVTPAMRRAYDEAWARAREHDGPVEGLGLIGERGHVIHQAVLHIYVDYAEYDADPPQIREKDWLSPRCGSRLSDGEYREVLVPEEGEIECGRCLRMMNKTWPHRWTPLLPDDSMWLTTRW